MMIVSFPPLRRIILCFALFLFGSAAGWANDAAEAQGVVRLVMARENIIDDITLFRRGSAPRIGEAMAQYVRIQAENSATPPARLVALRWALKQYLDSKIRPSYRKDRRNQHVPGSVTSFGENTYKCNKLVADAYAHGARRGLSVGSQWNGGGSGAGWPAKLMDTYKWPPTANFLADLGESPRNLSPAIALRTPGKPQSYPDLGDLILFPAEVGHGHVGLYIGKNLIISAKASGIEVGTLEKEQLEHQGIVRIRKFIDRSKGPLAAFPVVKPPVTSLFATKVQNKVRMRANVRDGLSTLRSGTSGKIGAVMRQYLDVQKEFQGKTPARLRALQWALTCYLNEADSRRYSYTQFSGQLTKSVSATNANLLKCAKFIADAYAVGANQGLSVGQTFDQSGAGTGWPARSYGGVIQPPVPILFANRNANLRSMTNARPLRLPGESKASPELGDIIVFPDSDGFGHMSLYLGKNLIVSAQSTGIEITEIVHEKSRYDNTSLIRKFTGSGK